MLLLKFLLYSKIWRPRSIPRRRMAMACFLPLRGLEMLLLFFYCVELLLTLVARCKLRGSSSGKQALWVSLWWGTFRFRAHGVSIRLLYSHVFFVLILLSVRVLASLVSFVRVTSFSYRELAEGAPCLAYQAWLFMGTRMLFLLLYNVVWTESRRTSIFILLLTWASRINLLFNGLISDNWLLCLFCARAPGMSSRALPIWWAITSWAVRGVPRFWFALASRVLPNDMLMSWRRLALIILIFTRIQIIAAGAVICILQLRRRTFLYTLSYRIRLLLISRGRLKKRATKVAWDKKAIARSTVYSIARWAPLWFVCIFEMIVKTSSMTLYAGGLRELGELTRVREVGHISRRA